MEFQELNLQNFGKFHNRKLYFKPGINLITGENEAGKSTVCQSVRALLFGMDPGKGRTKQDPYRLYEPWENPAWYAGSLKLEDNWGETWRISRSFYKNDKRSELISDSRGEAPDPEYLSEVLGGIDRRNYSNTLYVGQMAVEPDSTLGDSLRNCAANYRGTGDGTDLMGAWKRITLQKKEAEKELNGLTAGRERRLRELEAQQESAENSAARLTKDLTELRQSLKKGEAEADYFVKELEKQEQKRNDVDSRLEARIKERGPVLPSLLFFTAAVCSGVAAYFSRSQELLPFWADLILAFGGLLMLFLGILIPAQAGKKKRQEADALLANREIQESRSMEIWNRELQKKEENDQLRGRISQLESLLREQYSEMENLKEIHAEESEETEQEQALRLRVQGCDLALEHLKRSAEELRGQFGADFNRKASEILRQITGEKYKALTITEDFKLYLDVGLKRVAPEYVSRGTAEQIWFALRMAALEVLFPGRMPVILDDTFVYYDEVRLENVLKWIGKRKGQTLICSCQEREKAILDRLGIPYHQIEL